MLLSFVVVGFNVEFCCDEKSICGVCLGVLCFE